jgi:hypothetical protein
VHLILWGHSAARNNGMVGRQFQSATTAPRLSTDTVRAEHSVQRIIVTNESALASSVRDTVIL